MLIREDNAEGGFRAIPVRGKCEFWFDWRLVSAVRLAYGRCCACFTCGFRPCGASHFLLLRQKKVSKEKATPGSAPGVARSLALLRGTRKASRNNGSALEKTKSVFFGGRPLENGQNHFERFGGDAFPGPHVERRATELMADKGRGLSEARRAEFRSPRQQRVAQGSRQRRPRSLGSPFLWLLSFGEAKESTPARKAESNVSTRDAARSRGGTITPKNETPNYRRHSSHDQKPDRGWRKTNLKPPPPSAPKSPC